MQAICLVPMDKKIHAVYEDKKLGALAVGSTSYSCSLLET